MRVTVVGKILLSLGIIVGTGMVLLLTVYNWLTTIEHAVIHIAEPTGAAAYEMEINAIDTGLGVMKYLDTGEERYREQVKKNQADFERFLEQYLRLADTPEEEALGKRIARLYQKYRAIGEVVMDAKDRQDMLYAQGMEYFVHAHGVTEEMLRADGGAPVRPAWLDLARVMDVEIAHMGSWLGHYLYTRNPAYQARITAETENLRTLFTQLQGRDMSKEERHWLNQAEARFQATQQLVQAILAANDVLLEQVAGFLQMRSELDYLLHGHIQAQRQRDLDRAKESADRAAAFAWRVVTMLTPVFILFGLGAALLIIRTIQDPLRELNAGTAAIGQGDLAYRLPVKGRDEFADMGARFNDMVSQLERTTVSKNRLEQSQQALEEVNARLKDEIARRQRIEDNLKALSRQLLKAQETERRRIACELHDEIGQAVTAVKVNLDAMRLQCGEADTAGRLQDSIALVDGTLQQVRALAVELRPSILDDLGLVSALRWYLDQQAQRNGWTARLVTYALSTPTNPDVSVACFRIAQEALTNVARHAGARHVFVTLAEEDNELRLSVRDDGAGFEVEKAEQAAAEGKSMGILGMQERALLAGGALTIDSATRHGTEVRVRVPLG